MTSGFTDRQRIYAHDKFGSDQIYTPQLVVGGEQQLIGSDYAAALTSIAHVAAEASMVNLTVTTEPHDRSLVVRAVGATLGRIHSYSAARPELAARFDTDAIFFDIRLEPYLLATAHHGTVVCQMADIARTPCLMVPVRSASSPIRKPGQSTR